jgi:integrase
LEWVNFQVLRRTHSSLMREENIDPKIVADQLGHTLDVNLNVYTQTSLERRIEAVETLETKLVN